MVLRSALFEDHSVPASYGPSMKSSSRLSYHGTRTRTRRAALISSNTTVERQIKRFPPKSLVFENGASFFFGGFVLTRTIYIKGGRGVCDCDEPFYV